MKATKNLNSNLSSGIGNTFTRATNEAASASSSTSSNQGITNPVFNSSASSELVERRISSQRFSIPKPPPLPTLQTDRYFRTNIAPTITSAVNHCPSDDSDDTHRTLVISSANFDPQPVPSTNCINPIDDHSCEECVRFQAKKHHNHHHHHHHHHQQQQQQQTQSGAPKAVRQASKRSTNKVSRTPSSVPYLKPNIGFRPHPPQWYYLLGADSSKFRKHKHTYYHKNCKACKAIVRQSFEHYYLGQNSTPAIGYPVHLTEPNSSAPSESSSTTPLSFDNSDGFITERTSCNSSPQPYNHIMSPPTSNTSPMPPFYVLPRRRASCGHSCLKYTILFYCSVAVILAICAICYFTKMFGYIDPSLSFGHTSISSASTIPNEPFNSTTIGSNTTVEQSIISGGGGGVANMTGSGVEWTAVNGEESHTARIIDMLRAEVVALVIASVVMIIFFLGLIGGFLESVLCLRIFGAVLSYLFLLTFGAALYIVILLVISHVQSKLILSAISCAGVAITIHAAIAIAPFAFADLISQEKEDELKEMNNTSYMKFPSVRFLPMISSSGLPSKRRSSYFSLPFRASKRFLNRNNGLQNKHHPHMNCPPVQQSQSAQQHHSHHNNRSSDRATPTDSSQNIIFNTHQNHQDNSSSEGLIPAQSSVRFRDNWI